MDPVHQALAELDQLHQQLRTAYDAHDTTAVTRLLTDLSAAQRWRDRAIRRALTAIPTTGGAVPVREQVARALALLDRPPKWR